jgi:hypothetical protein
VLLPCASPVALQVAVLEFPDPDSVWVPQPEMVVPLALKATVPVGAPELTVETVAVKVAEPLVAELA